MLADTLTNEGECAQAAAVLARINVSAGGRTFSPEEVAEHYVRVAELYLEVRLCPELLMASCSLTRNAGRHRMT